MKAGSLLLPLLLLVGCQSPAPDPQMAQQIAVLSARVTALETQVAAQRDNVTASADKVTARAAAQNCAVALARVLETFRQGSLEERYPATPQLHLPDACQGQRVSWKKLDAQQYVFAVTNGDGQVLAEQSGL